jgi:5-methylcytosine-specific restriction endonuclease McrA
MAGKRDDLRTTAWRALSDWILERDGYQCAHCGQAADTVDHIVPKAVTGTPDNSPSNLQAMCRSCNSKKGAKTAPTRRAFVKAGWGITL